MIPVIEINHLSHSFGGKSVLKDINLQVFQGEIFGLLGPSGAGKTTLMKRLTGQLRHTDGSARLLGKDSNSLSAKEYLQIGTMMDHFGLYERLSVYNNLSFYADIYHVPKSMITDILQEVGLYKAKSTVVSKLSKGMKNRLSLARALMNNAKVLFLDEPTSGLDPVTTNEIHEILCRQRDAKKTIFLTTHNMFEAQKLCDRIALLDQGKIIESGTVSAICQKYNHLNKLQILLKDKTAVELENSPAAAETVKNYLERNQIETIHSTEPTLESVFIELTGKHLA